MIAELIALIGEEAFIKIACVFGGTKIYISSTEETKQRLDVVLGSESADKLIEAYHGSWIDIPRQAATKLLLRNKAIVKDYDEGFSPRQIALKFELSERRIWSILGKPL